MDTRYETLRGQIMSLPSRDCGHMVSNYTHNALLVDELKQWPELLEKFSRHKLERYGWITRMELRELVGEEASFDMGDNRIDIRADVGNARALVHGFRVEDGCIVLDKLRFCTEDFFRDYIRQVIYTKVIPYFIDAYQRGWIEKLPKMITFEPNIDLSDVTEAWLVDAFNEICEEYGNGERVRDMKFEKDERGVRAEFSVDCGGYGVHERNTMAANYLGYVKVELCEYLDGGDISVQLMRAVLRQIDHKTEAGQNI